MSICRHDSMPEVNKWITESESFKQERKRVVLKITDSDMLYIVLWYPFRIGYSALYEFHPRFIKVANFCIFCKKRGCAVIGRCAVNGDNMVLFIVYIDEITNSHSYDLSFLKTLLVKYISNGN